MLKQSPAPSEELYLTTKPKEPAAASRRSSHGLDLKDLDKLARNIGKFTPSVPNSQDVQAYLQDIDFHLEMRPNVTDKDRLYLLRTTSSSEVRSFLDRQPAHTKTDYQLLRKALIKEFADPESEQGLVAALETRQGHHEPPQAYYSRLRRAYFGTRNEPDMEDELNFKTLFLRNLHPGVSHHLDVLACPRTMNAQQLRDLAQKAYGKQKMASEMGAKTPAVLDFNTQSQGLALEGTQRQDGAKPPPREWNAPSSNKERDSHATCLKTFQGRDVKARYAQNYKSSLGNGLAACQNCSTDTLYPSAEPKEPPQPQLTNHRYFEENVCEGMPTSYVDGCSYNHQGQFKSWGRCGLAQQRPLPTATIQIRPSLIAICRNSSHPHRPTTGCIPQHQKTPHLYRLELCPSKLHLPFSRMETEWIQDS